MEYLKKVSQTLPYRATELICQALRYKGQHQGYFIAKYIIVLNATIFKNVPIKVGSVFNLACISA